MFERAAFLEEWRLKPSTNNVGFGRGHGSGIDHHGHDYGNDH